MTAQRDNGYAPIGSYGLLGDGRGSGLVASDGAIDWLAVPTIDTSPLLAAVVDAEEGGHLVIQPTTAYRVERRYEEATMVLETTFHTDGGTLTVTDALNQGFEGRLPWSELARRVEARGGPVPIRWELRPGNRLATVRPWVHLRDGVPFVLAGDLLGALVLDGMGQPQVDHSSAAGETVVEPGSPGLLALAVAKGSPLRLPEPGDVLRRLEHTRRRWAGWSKLIDYDGPHQGDLKRSALTLKSLASIYSGALAAAPTTSLPEAMGSSRSFDYRFGWVRDASYMIDAMTRLRLSEEVDASLSWLLRCVQRTAPAVHVFYTLDGEPASAEQVEKQTMEGYEGSSPVMVGNQAASQTQHGGYGDLFGAVARYVDNGGRLDTETGLSLVQLADRLCDEWPHPDAGLWELGTYRRYTSSLINSWNALHCAVRLAEADQMPSLHVERWRQAGDLVHAFADEHCWSAAKMSYTFYEGTEDLDAAVLLAARNGFLSPDDPRLWTTIDAVKRELTAEGPLLYRYTGAWKEENAFVACTFWLIEAMAIAGRVEEAGAMLEGALSSGNDLGLWSEEVRPSDGRLLGNFPIGISHLAVIGAITAYAEAVERKND